MNKIYVALCLLISPLIVYSSDPTPAQSKLVPIKEEMDFESPSELALIKESATQEKEKLKAFLENDANRSIIVKERKLYFEILRIDKAMNALHEEHPLKSLSDKELKRLHELELNGLPENNKDDEAHINLVNDFAQKERKLALQKISAELNLTKLVSSPQACDIILNYYKNTQQISWFEAQAYKLAYKKLVPLEQYEKDCQEVELLPSHEQYQQKVKDLDKNKGQFLRKFDRYSNSIDHKERYLFCPFALERERIIDELLSADKTFWEQKYHDQKAKLATD